MKRLFILAIALVFTGCASKPKKPTFGFNDNLPVIQQVSNAFLDDLHKDFKTSSSQFLDDTYAYAQKYATMDTERLGEPYEAYYVEGYDVKPVGDAEKAKAPATEFLVSAKVLANIGPKIITSFHAFKLVLEKDGSVKISNYTVKFRLEILPEITPY
jgi:hypothetical protein